MRLAYLQEQADAQAEMEAHMATCASCSYTEISRNPEAYRGQRAVFTGEVIQVMESTFYSAYRVNVTRGDYGLWTDTIYVVYYGDTSQNRFLEDDIVTLYGELAGLETYDSIFGETITIPRLDAVYVELQ